MIQIKYKGNDITNIDTPFGKFKIYQYENVFKAHEIAENDLIPKRIELIYKINKYATDNQMFVVINAKDLKIIDDDLTENQK